MPVVWDLKAWPQTAQEAVQEWRHPSGSLAFASDRCRLGVKQSGE